MTDVQQESGSRARTRQAIIDAAIDVLGRNTTATLQEIATAAEVGRTTLHRYFAERSDLVNAVRETGVTRLSEAHDRARLTDGTGAEALRRLCQEYFDLGNLLSLIFSEPQLVSDDNWADTNGCEPGFAAMVERGHHDGSIDPELPPEWVQSLMWSQLYAGWSYLSLGGNSRHHVLHLVLRTVSGAVTVPPRP